jgi:hypothetical protein
MQQSSKSSSGTFISPAASAGAQVVALEAEVLEAVLDALILGALTKGALEAVLVLVLLVLVLVAVEGVGSAARISASMSSKSSSVCACATVVSRRLPFLLLFGILRGKGKESWKTNRAAQRGGRCGGVTNCNTKVGGK